MAEEFHCIKYGANDNYLTQLENLINPYNTCNCTTMANALIYLGYDEAGFKNWAPSGMIERYKKEGNTKFTKPSDFRLSDKLTYLCLTDPRIDNFYSSNYKNEYKSYVKERDGSQSPKNYFGVDKTKCKRYPVVTPPNEQYACLVQAANLAYKDCFHKSDTICSFGNSSSKGVYDLYEYIKEIYSILASGSPVLTSVQYGKLGHILLISGIKYYIDPNARDPKIRCTGFYVDDPYGYYDFKNGKYIDAKSRYTHGYGYGLSYGLDWLSYVKETNKTTMKRCIRFKKIVPSQTIN